MTKPKPEYRCKHCDKPFANLSRGQNFCSLRCALFSKVEVRGEDECWQWLASKKPFGKRRDAGYGQFNFLGTLYAAHVVSYTLAHGSPNGLPVMHQCDDPGCCNPRHLQAGTRLENMAGMSTRGRAVVPKLSGRSHPMARLSPGDIDAVLRLRTEGVPIREICTRISISKTHAYRIVNGRVA